MTLFKEIYYKYDIEKIKWFHNVILLNNYATGIENIENIEIVKWKYELSLIDPRIIFDKKQVFSYSCSMNNMTVAKYIYELGDIVVTDTVFQNCNFDFLKWFYELDDSIYHTNTSKFNNNYYHDIIKLEKKVFEQQTELDILKEQVKVILELVKIIAELTVSKRKLF